MSEAYQDALRLKTLEIINDLRRCRADGSLALIGQLSPSNVRGIPLSDGERDRIREIAAALLAGDDLEAELEKLWREFQTDAALSVLINALTASLPEEKPGLRVVT